MKEKDTVDTDPAISTTLSMLNLPSILSSSLPHPFIPKPKVKTRVTNGKEKLNGSTSAGKKESKPKEKKVRTAESNEDANGSAISRPNRGTRAAPREEWPDVRPAEPTGHPSGALLSNGASPYRYARQPQWAANTTTMRSDDFVEDPHSRRVEHRYISPPREGDGWNGGQYTGPASAFLQPFHRVVPNPGRTIYSQQQP
jgi:hypothetical protein